MIFDKLITQSADREFKAFLVKYCLGLHVIDTPNLQGEST